MPRLLDNRVIGGAADVLNRDASTITPGGVMMLSPSKKLYLEDGEIFQATKDAPQDRSGISLQQWLCRQWVLSSNPVSLGGPFTAVFGLAYGAGKFVAVGINGAAGVLRSTSLQDLVKVTPMVTTWSPTANNPFTGGIFGVTFAKDRFLACGANGQIAVSYDGSNWTLVHNPGNTQNLYRIAYAPGKGYVAVGSVANSGGAGVTLYSADGDNWTTVSPALDNGTYSNVPIYGVGYGGGKFLAVGGVVNTPTNHIATSADGVNWTVRTSSQPLAAHYTTEYGNGRWIIGTNGVGATIPYTCNLITSLEGINWASCILNTPDSTNEQIVVYGNGMWCTAGFGIQGSVDGISFDRMYTPSWPGTNGTGSAGCYGNGIFVMGNRNGYIYRSAVLPEIVTLLSPT
jgi:hypothetical protein